MLFVALLAVLGYIRAAERRRDGRSTLGIWLTTRLCRMLFAVLLHAAVMPIMCVTLAFSLMHIVENCLCYVYRRMGGVGDQSSQSRAERRALEKTRRKLRKRLRPYRWLLGRYFMWWLRIGRCVTRLFWTCLILILAKVILVLVVASTFCMIAYLYIVLIRCIVLAFNVWNGSNVFAKNVLHPMCNLRGGGTDSANGGHGVYVETAQERPLRGRACTKRRKCIQALYAWHRSAGEAAQNKLFACMGPGTCMF